MKDVSASSWITICVGVMTITGVFFSIGYHMSGLAKDISSLQGTVKESESQILIWLDDAEIQRVALGRQITNTNNFLIRKFPEYQTYD